jgi:HSP20 family molecular chaperone IbpA
MIVVGSRGRGWLKGTVFGSVSSALVHRADRPVLVVRSARRLPVTAPDAAALAMTEPDADVAVATAATPAATAAPAAAADADSPGDVMPAAGRPLIAVELPGMSPDDVELEVGGDTLIVRASHTVHGDGDSTVVERVYARFALPRGTRPEDLAATLVDGVLSVALAPATKPRVELPVATT